MIVCNVSLFFVDERSVRFASFRGAEDEHINKMAF